MVTDTLRIERPHGSFNPCFNGFMDKWGTLYPVLKSLLGCFNPCFNGFMDKWINPMYSPLWLKLVSTLVLMDSWINGPVIHIVGSRVVRVSTLVLMDSWINGASL